MLAVPNHQLRVAVGAMEPFFEAACVVAFEGYSSASQALDVHSRGSKRMKHVPLFLSR